MFLPVRCLGLILILPDWIEFFLHQEFPAAICVHSCCIFYCSVIWFHCMLSVNHHGRNIWNVLQYIHFLKIKALIIVVVQISIKLFCWGHSDDFMSSTRHSQSSHNFFKVRIKGNKNIPLKEHRKLEELVHHLKTLAEIPCFYIASSLTETEDSMGKVIVRNTEVILLNQNTFTHTLPQKNPSTYKIRRSPILSYCFSLKQLLQKKKSVKSITIELLTPDL